MRIAVFTDNDFDKVNGVTTTLTALVEHAPPDLSPRIYTASSRASDTPDYLALPSLPLPIPFYSEMKMYVPRWRTYLRRVIEDKIEVLHLTTPGPLGLAAVWTAAQTGIPLVGSFHTDLARYTEVLSGSARLARLIARYMRWMYGRCLRTLAPSRATRELLVASGLHAGRVNLWPRGVDTGHFTPARRSSLLRERWQVRAHERVLLYVGRVSREKGLDLLPGVVARLVARGLPHRLVIAGDGPYRRGLEEQLPDAIFTGTLDRQAVADVFASADLFVFPSTTDTAGNVVLEAQASGLPVIVSASGGPQEQMRPSVTGVVCRGSEPELWAHEIASVLSRPQQLAEMARAARAFALERRWSQALAPLYQTYRDARAYALDRVAANRAA